LSPDYEDEITTCSFQELERLAYYSNRQSLTLHLIGGWACWYYHKGLGSRDIDIIFPYKALVDRFLIPYYRQNGFGEEKTTFADTRYVKRVEVNNRNCVIRIDAAGIDDGRPFHEDETRNIPYTELKNYSIEWNLPNGGIVNIPRAELLLLQKTKAYRDRDFESRKTIDKLSFDSLQEKCKKDRYDIHGIVDRIENWDIVREICIRNRCLDLIQDAFGELGISHTL